MVCQTTAQDSKQPTEPILCREVGIYRPSFSNEMQRQCKEWLTWALRSLNGQPSDEDLERISQLIWLTVTTRSRSFHNFDHILCLAESEDPIVTLAAFFHDAIYVQVDWGLIPEVVDYLTPFLLWKNGALHVRSVSDLKLDADVALVTALFGLNHTEPVLAERFNEFLSSILAVRCLKPWLSHQQLAQIVVAIEATIPFRSKADFFPAEQLFDRFTQVNQEFRLGLTLLEQERAIHRSVELANRDVENFNLPNPVLFLDNTWQLLPELNPELRDPRSYSIRDYRKALRAMESFLVSLDANQVFQQFRQVPNPLIYQAYLDRTQHNLATARLYISTKLVAIAVLEALMFRPDQNLPLTDWLGRWESSSCWENRFESFEDQISRNLVEQQVFRIVTHGRLRPCRFDMLRSPFTAFLLRSFGFEKVMELRPSAEAFFNEELTRRAFLDLVPRFEIRLQSKTKI